MNVLFIASVAEACFGTPQWPADRAIPQASIEFEVRDAEALPRCTMRCRAGRPIPAAQRVKTTLPNRSPLIIAAKPSAAALSGIVRSISGRTPVCSQNLISLAS